MLIRGRLLDAVGGFADVSAPDMYIQDKALGLRYRVRIVPNVKAYHIREVTFRRAVKT